MDTFMRFTAVVAVVLVSGGMALAQKIKEPTVRVRPVPGISAHGTIAPPPVRRNSSADELAKVEQQTARVRLNKPVAHRSSSGPTATPALDLGKNKGIRVTGPPQSPNPSGH